MRKRSDEQVVDNVVVPVVDMESSVNPIDTVKRGDLVLLNPGSSNSKGYRYYKDRPDDNEFVIFIAQVDNHIVVEQPTKVRQLIQADWLKEIVFVKPVMYHGGSG